MERMSDKKIVFKKPYKFESNEYQEIDLSGLDQLKTSDLIDADKQFSSTGQFSVMNEIALGYTCIVAAKATGKPVEFFENLPAGDGLKVKNTVMAFLNA